MHPATRSTLISTVLLGILLYAILRFADGLMGDAEKLEEAERQDRSAFREQGVRSDTPVITESASQEIDPYLPRIQSYDDLVTLLDQLGLNGLLVVEDAARWYAERGYLDENTLLGVTPEGSRSAYYATLDTATLRAMSDAGDAGATQTLARLAMFDDPIAALELYEKAVTQGSVYASVKVADTLSIFKDLRLEAQASDPEFRKMMRDLPKRYPSSDLDTESYATILAAMSDGGPPVSNDELLNWGSWLEERTRQYNIEYACKRSADILIANSMARQANGVAPVSMKPPPVFLSPADREQRIPCSATAYPIASMMKLEECLTQRIIDETGKEQDLYICQP
jgi:hypothetical protein